MKKKVIIISVVIIFVLLLVFTFFYFNHRRKVEKIIKDAKLEVVLVDDLTVEFLDKKKVSSFISSINGKIVDDYEIDTSSLGKKDISFEFITDNGVKIPYQYQINIVDTVPPVAFIGNTYRIKKGSSDRFINNIICGDNYDSRPICTVEGDFDLDTNGVYPVTFKAVDNSGNVFKKNFSLIVYTPESGSNNTTTKNKPKVLFSDVVKAHKTTKTRIGLDISKWQGNIDFDALKKAGVEFVMIRVGTTRGTNGEYVLDPKFVQNITSANRVGIDVGLYFYSYANTKESALADAEWVLDQIKDYDIKLPIAFDWEEWPYFNNFRVSFYELTSIADTFLKRLEDEGYKGMLYSSKNYLEKIWLEHPYEVWLAHYTTQTDYKGKYRMWQLCSNGKVDGIKGDVDINVWYND